MDMLTRSPSETIAHSPASSPAARKRAADENTSELPKKKRLLGRALDFGLQDVDNNAVSNPINPEHFASQKKQLFGRSLTTLDSSPSPITDTTSKSPTLEPESLADEPSALPTPPNEASSPFVPSSRPALVSEFARTTGGKRAHLVTRTRTEYISYEQLIAGRSQPAAAGKATQDFYGINIHKLVEEAENAPKQAPLPESLPQPVPSVEVGKGSRRAGLMWTEKYRAKKFTDLVGDERTHRTVLRWLKAWDPIVFPGAKTKVRRDEENPHRKILMLTGPPGLGKTTLAHVCARQAGYEIVEINASDERSKDVVRNKIRDCVGTENVRGVNVKSTNGNTTRRPGKPVCLIVDEVDGVVSGSGGAGDGGFMKALIDLVQLDQRNSRFAGSDSTTLNGKKRDKFKMLRPLILVCNDIYHPSLRPLRAAGLAEIVHVRKPGLDRVIERVKNVFESEGVACDPDAARRLCEHTWGVSNRKEGKTGASSADGDMRSVLVVSEWAATKLRATSRISNPRLIKQWVDTHIASGPTSEGGRGLGRGGIKEAAERIFIENAGFAKTKARDAASTFIMPGTSIKAANDVGRQEPIRKLREVVETIGDFDRIMTEVFTTYPKQEFQDDSFLTKPNAAYEWLHFHDSISARVFSGQEWELIPYSSTPAVGFHYLFGTSARKSLKPDVPMKDAQQSEEEVAPFSGPRADFEAREAQRETKATIETLQRTLNIDLHRMFRSPQEIAVDLLPHLIRMLTPEVKPVVVGGKGESMASVRREGEKDMVRRAVQALAASGTTFERLRIEDQRTGHAGWIYRMEPALDSIATFETLNKSASSATSARYAVRQIMDQEHHKFQSLQAADARQARFNAGGSGSDVASAAQGGLPSSKVIEIPAADAVKVKRDFFGRVIKPRPESADDKSRPQSAGEVGKCHVKVWVSFNEGYSNAVKKPITLRELLDGL